MLDRLLGELLTDVEEIRAAKAYQGHQAKGSLPTWHLLRCSLLGLEVCFGGLPLFHERLPGGTLGVLRVVGFALVVAAAAVLARSREAHDTVGHGLHVARPEA